VPLVHTHPMKAIVLTRFGSSDALRLAEVDKPVPGVREVLVKVHATAVNDWDWGFMRGRPLEYRPFFGLLRPKVGILGAEVAGLVEAVGPGVSRFRAGDEIYGDISESGFGGFAEYVAVHEDALAPKPPEMSFEEAASLPHASMLALQGLIDHGRIRDGQSVLINGAGGGVGTLGVQIAKTYQAETTGVDSGAKLDMLRATGFDRVIDYKREDFTKSGLRYDLILDTKTSRSPLDYARALRPSGRYVTVGGQTGRILQTLCSGPVFSLLSHKRMRIVALKPNKDLDRVSELFQAGRLKCVIDGPYQLSDVPQAIDYFGKARHKGKIVISVVPDARMVRQLPADVDG
jgi:NADPH:quinone reductase-like Zn-dependent oxidoreductase